MNEATVIEYTLHLTIVTHFLLDAPCVVTARMTVQYAVYATVKICLVVSRRGVTLELYSIVYVDNECSKCILSFHHLR